MIHLPIQSLIPGPILFNVRLHILGVHNYFDAFIVSEVFSAFDVLGNFYIFGGFDLIDVNTMPTLMLTKTIVLVASCVKQGPSLQVSDDMGPRPLRKPPDRREPVLE